MCTLRNKEFPFPIYHLAFHISWAKFAFEIRTEYRLTPQFLLVLNRSHVILLPGGLLNYSPNSSLHCSQFIWSHEITVRIKKKRFIPSLLNLLINSFLLCLYPNDSLMGVKDKSDCFSPEGWSQIARENHCLQKGVSHAALALGQRGPLSLLGRLRPSCSNGSHTCKCSSPTPGVVPAQKNHFYIPLQLR